MKDFWVKSRENLNHRIYRTENWGNYRTLQDFVLISGHLQDFLAEFQIYRILQDYRTSGSPAASYSYKKWWCGLRVGCHIYIFLLFINKLTIFYQWIKPGEGIVPSSSSSLNIPIRISAETRKHENLSIRYITICIILTILHKTGIFYLLGSTILPTKAPRRMIFQLKLIKLLKRTTLFP